jgi:hypothetical protein
MIPISFAVDDDSYSSVSTLSFADERSHDVSMRTAARQENTYQLTPRQKFPAGQVQEVIKKLLEEYLEHEQYKPDLCRQMSKSLSEVCPVVIIFI